MTADEKKRARYERFVETKRSRWSLRTSAFATVVSIAIAFAVFCGVRADNQPAMTLLQLLLAMSLGAAVVAGSRALDGPLRFGDRRRDVPSSTPAAAAVLLWLTCFGVLAAAFLVVHVVDRWQLGAPRCDVGAGGSFKSVQTTSQAPERSVVRVVECEVRAPVGESQAASNGNRADSGPPAGDSADGGQNQ